MPAPIPAPVWERNESDTAKSYAAFCIYRDMGSKRSLQKAADAYYRKSDANRTQFTKWSSDHNWQARVQSWDEHQQALSDEEHEEARKQIIEDELADYRLQLTKWRESYERTKLHELRSRKKTEDGIIELIELEVHDWHTLSKWRDEIAKQGRRALGMPDKIERRESTGEVAHKHTHKFDIAKMTDDELSDLIASSSGES